MSGENNLETLLNTMEPALAEEAYVFVSQQTFPQRVIDRAIMSFREKEGVTLILPSQDVYLVDAMRRQTWAMITMTVHSDLTAVGFLARLTEKLAAGKISVNAVSAFYHDHLFVPWEKRNEAMAILQNIGE